MGSMLPGCQHSANHASLVAMDTLPDNRSVFFFIRLLGKVTPSNQIFNTPFIPKSHFEHWTVWGLTHVHTLFIERKDPRVYPLCRRLPEKLPL